MGTMPRPSLPLLSATNCSNQAPKDEFFVRDRVNLSYRPLAHAKENTKH